MLSKNVRSGRGLDSEMVKVVTIFLIVLAVLAMFGRLRMPKLLKRDKTKLPGTEKCSKCGAMKIEGTDCACERRSK